LNGVKPELAIGVPEAVSVMVLVPIPVVTFPLAVNVTPLAVLVDILYVPPPVILFVTFAIMVWVTPDTVTPAVIVPVEVVGVYVDIAAVPFEEREIVVLVKDPTGVVFRV
jgi:hypothetical protein